MLYTKPFLSVILWLAFFRLVDTKDETLTWDFKYRPPDLVDATIGGTVPPCGLSDDDAADDEGRILDLTVKCNGERVFKHTWENETPLFLVEGRDFPHTFTISTRSFPVGTPCMIILNVFCHNPIESPEWIRREPIITTPTTPTTPTVAVPSPSSIGP